MKTFYLLVKNVIKFFYYLSQSELNLGSVFKVITKSKFDKNTLVYSPCSISEVIIGYGTYIASHSNVHNTTIGKFCSIGPNFFCGYGIHPINGISTSPMFYSTKKQNGITLSCKDKIIEREPIIIGNDVFIGANVTVLDGVKIGDGAVIGAGAVVTKDIPPYAIALGVPARVVKFRFDDIIITKMLKIQWWNWPEDQLKEIEQEFFSVRDFVSHNQNDVDE